MLLGHQLHHQVLPLELLQGGALGSLTACNSLLLTAEAPPIPLGLEAAAAAV